MFLLKPISINWFTQWLYSSNTQHNDVLKSCQLEIKIVHCITCISVSILAMKRATQNPVMTMSYTLRERMLYLMFDFTKCLDSSRGIILKSTFLGSLLGSFSTQKRSLPGNTINIKNCFLNISEFGKIVFFGIVFFCATRVIGEGFFPYLFRVEKIFPNPSIAARLIWFIARLYLYIDIQLPRIKPWADLNRNGNRFFCSLHGKMLHQGYLGFIFANEETTVSLKSKVM